MSTSLTTAYEKYASSEVSKLDAAVAKYLGLKGSTTLIGSDYIISPYIEGGYLNIVGNGNRVVIDPANETTTGYAFFIKNSSNEIVMGVNNSGDAEFKGTVYATGGEFTGKVNASSGYIGENGNGWQITSNTLITKNDASIVQISASSNGSPAMRIVDGKAIFGLYGTKMHGYFDDQIYVDISYKGIYAKNGKTGYDYSFMFDNLNNVLDICTDSFNIYSTTNFNDEVHCNNGIILYSTAGKGIKSTSGGNVIRPNNANDVYIGGGSANAIWLGATNIYYTNKAPVASGSDKRIKHDITALDENHTDFIMSLKPCSYKFNDGTSNRTHWGFIADELEESMLSTTGDSGVFVKMPKDGDTEVDLDEPSTYICGIRYSELIAPMVKTIQDQQQVIQTQQQDIQNLNDEVLELKENHQREIDELKNELAQLNGRLQSLLY